MFSYQETLERQIAVLDKANEALEKRLNNPNWTNSKDVSSVAGCITKNVQTIAELAADLEKYLNPPTEKAEGLDG